MKIFISHNSKDKPIVGEIAQQLASAFGQENVFYDSWSIQPGDDILDRMNEGLEKSDVFFFFMSPNSLSSDMVKIEWQSALFRKIKQNNVRFIPVLIGDTTIPSLIAQKLYIDIIHNGIEAGIRQMVDIVKGSNTYHANDQVVDNLVQKSQINGNKLSIKISARFYMEPIAQFLITIPDKEISYEVLGESAYDINVWSKDEAPLQIDSPQEFYVHYLRVDRPITVDYPLCININLPKVYNINNINEFVYGLFHRKREDYWEIVPDE